MLPKDFLTTATEPIKIVKISYHHNSYDFIKMNFSFSNGVKTIDTPYFGQGDEDCKTAIIENSRKWTSGFWYVPSDERWPYAFETFKFDKTIIGAVRAADNFKHCEVTEELSENEMICGVTFEVCEGVLRNICFKKCVIPKMTSSKFGLSISKTVLDNIKFYPSSNLITKEAMIQHLIKAELPSCQENDASFSDDIEKFVFDNLTARKGDKNFSIAMNFLTHISTMALKKENS